MSEINKEQFGGFIAMLRKEKNMTQKELAGKLFISAKAISKWETGVSMPDINMLLPLAEILDVTVTELLRGQRIEKDESINKESVEDLVRKAIKMTEVEIQTNNSHRRKYMIGFMVAFIMAFLETLYLIYMNFDVNQLINLLVFLVSSFIVGIYFTFIAKDQLPTFYDENKISFYTDGIFRMNMPGLYFNNSNWPHISNYMSVWVSISLIVAPFLFYFLEQYISHQVYGFIVLFVMLGTLFIPIYIIGKKYE